MGGTNSKRYRAQLPRISAQSGTAFALIIKYFQQCPLDLKVVTKELIYNAYLVRSMRCLNEYSVDDSELLIKPEAWKSIWYFWGVIESICIASGVDSLDVLERLKSQGKPPNGASKEVGEMRVSDLATLLEQESNGAGGDSGISEDEEDSIERRREDISSVFGN